MQIVATGRKGDKPRGKATYPEQKGDRAEQRAFVLSCLLCTYLPDVEQISPESSGVPGAGSNVALEVRSTSRRAGASELRGARVGLIWGKA